MPMDVDPPSAVEAFVFEGLPSASGPKANVPAAPPISKEEQEKRDLAAYFRHSGRDGMSISRIC